jgi:hypothetical protein
MPDVAKSISNARTATAPSVDESQIRERLRLTPAERLRLFASSQRNLVALTAKARRVPR